MMHVPARHPLVASLTVVVLAALPLATAATTQPETAETTYSVVALGLPPGTDELVVHDMNAAGAVVGAGVVVEPRAEYAVGGPYGDGAYTGGSTYGTYLFRPVLWQGGAFTWRGDAGTQGRATAINDAGQIVTWVEQADANRATLWTGDAAADLAPLPGDAFVFPYAVNQLGHVVGYSKPHGYLTHAALWKNGTVTDLGTLRGASTATSINARGQIVGFSDLYTGEGGRPHAVLWDAGHITDLGTLGGDESYAWRINDAGQIVGAASTVPGNFQTQHAFLWRNGALTDLGTLPGYAESAARDVNAAGQAVGSAFTADTGDSTAVLWQAGRIVDLNTVLPVRSTIRLREAVAITDAGHILCVGRDEDDADARSRGFVLTPITLSAR